ncbi:MAG: hypothetical protein M1480_10535 [Bacteroidetes bacterium]|nr:hypothetical protein [Bacteroidota bacterium]
MEPLLFELLSKMEQKGYREYDSLYSDLASTQRENLISIELKLNEFKNILKSLNREMEYCVDCFIKYSMESKLINFLKGQDNMKYKVCLLGYPTKGRCLHDILNFPHTK